MELLAWRCSVKGETWSLPTTALGSLFQTKTKEGKVAFSRDARHGSYIRRKPKTRLEETRAQRAAGTGAVPGKGCGERVPTAPPGGLHLKGLEGPQEDRRGRV